MNVLALTTAVVLGAGTFDTIYQTGVQAYEEGDYHTAAESFEQLIAEGVVDPAVFYNLGNAYYRAGEVGPAIANYERALQLRPGLVVARENLVRAVNATERRLSKPAPPAWEQSLLFWHDTLTPQAAYWAAIVCWFAFWTALAVRRFKSVKYLRIAALVLLVLSAAFATSLYAKSHPQQLAVASEHRVPVHYDTDTEETVRFELYEGDRVLVDERRDGWARVVTAHGERGWAQAGNLTFVGPPYESAKAPTVSAKVDTS